MDQDKSLSKKLLNYLNRGNFSSEQIIQLLNDKADPNYIDEKKITALNILSREYLSQDKQKIIKLLIFYKADVNIANNAGTNCLHTICSNKYATKELIELYIKNCADINLPNGFGESPLHLSITYHNNQQFVSLLISYNANINLENKCQETPLFLSCKREFYNHQIIQVLLSNGAKVDSRNYNGHSALQNIMQNTKADPQSILLLIKKGDLNFFFELLFHLSIS